MVLIGYGLIIMLFWLIFMAIAVLGTVFWIWMIVDAAKRSYKKEEEKVLWILIVVLGGLIGSIVYYFVVIKAK